MLSQLQGSYQRLEQSLQRLTDSIASYNPSYVAAEELVSADEAVTQDLEQLAVHQTNHARIQNLSRTADSLDETLKSTIRALAETRRRIQTIPASNDRERSKDVDVDALLSYAKFISKTTVPPTFRKPIPEISVPRPQRDDRPQAQITNGIATPPVGALEGGNAAYVKAENVGIEAMDEQAKRHLDPLKDLPFEPWPSYGIMQGGALADIQRMMDNGKDPASVLSAEGQAEADRRKKEEEERERLEEEARERRRMSMFQASAQRGQNQDDVFDPDEA